jgi:hypothetical protein
MGFKACSLLRYINLRCLAHRAMLVCGCVNPPPVDDPEYRGVYFNTNDNMTAAATKLGGVPLLVEHSTKSVGSIISAWTADNGSMFALAEIDVKKPGGALAAEFVRSGRLGEFSLGYTARMMKCKQTGGFKPESKQIHELSLVKRGARPGCMITKIQ